MNKYSLLIVTSLFVLTSCGGTMPMLGIDANKLSPCPDTPNCVSSQATDEAHFIEPILVSASVEDTSEIILRVLDDFSRVKVTQVEPDYIRAEFTSLVFRFVDDVEFYFPASEAGVVRVDIRSASRVGRSDLGVNRKRMETIRQKIGEFTGVKS
jgi:uncharacterized protein (DUF1499 family)